MNMLRLKHITHFFFQKVFKLFISLSLLLVINASYAQDKLNKIVIAGPAAGVTYPLVNILETKALQHVADKVEFILWTNPDQLRALALSNKADFIALPTNVAANLYNRKADIKLLNVSQWGVLWMVSRDPNMQTLADFKGKEVVIPFRADMPDIVFSTLVEKQGLDIKKDFKISYSATPLDAMQLLITRRADHVLLAEPAVSMALRKTKSFPASVIAPELFRSVNLQTEWGATMNGKARIPQAGIAVLGDMNKNTFVIQEFLKAYEASNIWCYENPQKCGEQVEQHIKMLNADGVSDALKAQKLDYANAQDVASELNDFFQVLLDKSPALIGGNLPDKDFIY